MTRQRNAVLGPATALPDIPSHYGVWRYDLATDSLNLWVEGQETAAIGIHGVKRNNYTVEKLKEIIGKAGDEVK